MMKTIAWCLVVAFGLTFGYAFGWILERVFA
jgi:hypothetical protein